MVRWAGTLLTKIKLVFVGVVPVGRRAMGWADRVIGAQAGLATRAVWVRCDSRRQGRAEGGG